MATNDEDNRLNLIEGEGIKLTRQGPPNGTLTIDTNIDIASPNGTIDVQSSTIDPVTKKKTLNIDIKSKGYYIGNKGVTEIGVSSYNITNNLVKSTGTLDITQPGAGLYLVCVNINIRPTGLCNEQHEVWLSIGPNYTYTMMQNIDWSNAQDNALSCTSIIPITGNEPISITLSYGSTPSIGLDLTIENVSVYRLE